MAPTPPSTWHPAAAPASGMYTSGELWLWVYVLGDQWFFTCHFYGMAMQRVYICTPCRLAVHRNLNSDCNTTPLSRSVVALLFVNCQSRSGCTVLQPQALNTNGMQKDARQAFMQLGKCKNKHVQRMHRFLCAYSTVRQGQQAGSTAGPSRLPTYVGTRKTSLLAG